MFIAFGRKASLASETKKFYKALYESRRNKLQLLVNSPLLEVEDVGDVIGETPDRLAISLQFFLQGCGNLLSLLPHQKIYFIEIFFSRSLTSNAYEKDS